MLRSKTLALLALPLGAAVALPQTAVVAQAVSPIARVQAHLKAVSTMTANFSQTDRRGRTVSGSMTMKRPGKVRFQYQPNYPILIVADGKKLSMIDYESGRVDDWPIRTSPLGVLLNANPDLARIARVVRDDRQTLLLQARDPKRREFGTITLGFAKVAGGPAGLVLQGWTVIDAQNNRTTVKLSNQRFNVGVADSAFTFQRPTRKKG